MKNNQKRSVLKTLAIVAISALFGLAVSTVGHSAASFMEAPLPLDWFAQGFGWFLYGVLVVEVVLGIYFAGQRRKIKSEGYSDEEHSTYTRNERRYGLLQGIGTTLSVGSIPLFFATMFYCGIYNVSVFVAFLAIVLVNLINEVSWIRIDGRINPKLDVDWSKLSFHSDLYQRLDEREKEQMGQIGAKVVNSFHILFAIAFMVTVFLSPVLDFSGYELVVIALLWGAFTLFITVQKYKLG